MGRNGRLVRDDKVLTRRLIREGVVSRGPDDRVSQILADVEAMLATPPSRQGMRLEARGPYGEVIHANTQLKNWRARNPEPTEAEREARQRRREEVDYARVVADEALEGLEEGLEQSEAVVPEAVMGALVDRYGVDSVRAAIRELRLAA